MARSMRTGVSGLPGYFMRLNARRASRLMQVLRANRTSLPSERRRFLACLHALDGAENRSEEHTSELQSLMRISYADFCLSKTTSIVKDRPHNEIKINIINLSKKTDVNSKTV